VTDREFILKIQSELINGIDICKKNIASKGHDYERPSVIYAEGVQAAYNLVLKAIIKHIAQALKEADKK
jgi:hypothetical protein